MHLSSRLVILNNKKKMKITNFIKYSNVSAKIFSYSTLQCYHNSCNCNKKLSKFDKVYRHFHGTTLEISSKFGVRKTVDCNITVMLPQCHILANQNTTHFKFNILLFFLPLQGLQNIYKNNFSMKKTISEVSMKKTISEDYEFKI